MTTLSDITEIHFDTCGSTQKYLIDYLDNLPFKNPNLQILVTAKNQTQGFGRNNSSWDFFENSLAMSFTLKSHPVPTLTPIEIGILCCDYFKNIHQINLFLKWPNDLLNDAGQKVGGILCYFTGTPAPVIAGVGINLSSPISKNLPIYKTAPAHINLGKHSNLAIDLYRYIYENQTDAKTVKPRWNALCFHKNKLVRIEDGNTKSTGTFLGIGELGEALIHEQGNLNITSFFSGSLFLLE